MNNIKSFIKYLIFSAIFVIVLILLFEIFEDKNTNNIDNIPPQIDQKIWTYNVNTQSWKKYSNNDNDSSGSIILKLVLSEEEPNKTCYDLISYNASENKKILMGENSIEFIKNNKLYSYYTKDFQYYEIIYNGVEFVPRKLNEKEILELFNNSKIIKVSDIIKGNYQIKYSKNTYIILNDIGEKFYRYYIIPNDNGKLQIGSFANQLKVNTPIKIELQRLEGCTKAYPCYDFDIIK